MFHPIENGTQITLKKYGYKVWIPEQPRDSEIAYFNLKKSEQYFRRTKLPDWWEDRRAEEKYEISLQWEDYLAGRIKYKDLYVDPQCEEFRRQEWNRRLNGFWFFNNGVPTYITGPHYYYLNWTRWDHSENEGYPVFYVHQVERFYFRQLCEEDPASMGYTIIGPRGTGKSTEEIACQVEKMTRPPRRSKAAIQSKSDDDATEKLFQEKAVPMFNSLPDFFKPEYNHGTYPKDRFSFHRDKVTGKKVKSYIFNPEHELENYVYSVAAKAKTLDGGTYRDIIQDEIGKTPKHIADVYKRVKVNRQCVYRNNTKIGILRCCTTVEELDEGGKECKDLWDASDPNRRTTNGRTLSWLYRYPIFIQEVDKNFADKYGYIDEEEAAKYHAAEIEDRLTDHDEYADYARKNPMDETHFWIKKPGSTTFNQMIISNYKNEVTKHNNLWVKGNFKFTGEEWKSPVEFERDDLSGRWQVCWLLDEEGMPYGEQTKTKLANHVYRDRDYAKNKMMIYPGNNHLFNWGIDPIKDVKTKDPRASKMCAKLFFKYNDNFDRGKELKDWFSHRFVARYHQRLDDPEECFKDVAMGMLYYGCWANIEKNVGDFHSYLKGKGMDPFIMTGLDFDIDMSFADNSRKNEEAVQTTTEVHQAGLNRIRKFYVKHYPERVIANPWVETQDQYLDFEPEQITRFDEVVADMYALLGAEAIVPDQYQPNSNEDTLNDWFDFADISGSTPRMVEDEEFDFNETLY